MRRSEKERYLTRTIKIVRVFAAQKCIPTIEKSGYDLITAPVATAARENF